MALSGEDFAWIQCIAKQGISAIRSCYSHDWRRLLRILTYVHELGGLAIENDATLCDFGEDAILSVTRSGEDKQDDELTTLLTAYFNSYPHGGLQGLGNVLVAAADTDGIAGVEIVPTPDATGVALPPILVDGLSLRFHEDQQGALELQQKQSATLLGTGGIWKPLDTTSIFVRGWRSSDNNLLGLPRYARFLRVGLPDIWEQLMLSDWVQTQAYGRIAGEMDIDKAWEAIKNGADSNGVNPLLVDEDGTTISPFAALANIIADAKASFEALESSDTLFGAGVTFKAVNPAGSGIKDAFELRAGRLYASLHQPPVLMYSRSGGALSTSSTEEILLHAGVLTSVRSWAAWFVETAGNFVLRLWGQEATCKLEMRPIKLTDGINEARAEALRLRNSGQRVLMGFSSGDDEARKETGTELSDPTQHEAWKAAQTDKPAPSDGSSGSQGSGNGNGTGN